MRQSQDEKKPPEHQTEHCIIPFSSSQHTEKKLSRFPITKNEKGTQERLMIDLEQIYVAVDEFSIEEIRARQSCYASDINTEENSGRPHSRPPDKRPNTGNQQSDKYHCIPVAPSPQTLNYSTEDSNTQQSSQAKSLLHTSPKDFDDRVFDTARRMTASSPTLHTKYASAEMNKIFSDRSRSRRSMDSQWSAEDSQGVEEDELEKFTMAYSIPNIPWEFTTPSYEILENEIQDGYDEDDDQARDKTEDFLRKLEQGFPSTITQDIEALKRKRAEEGESNRLSFLPNKRSPFRSDPSRRQSDITMVIEQKVRQMQQHQHHQMEEQVEDTWRYVSEEASYVEDSESMGMRSHSLQDTENASSIGNDIPSTRTLQVFCDDTGNLDSDLNIPMLEDEAPPPFLDHEDLL
ncbi:hypothetical protein BX616_004766 [Lobosporangium transversale]|uniref:Uncharacterized protein n=1 Tax=Lobosporangium transversale TaxID=64571 RepID=A0A1Y2GBE2_9FUNG|nr:hypothetical protein BCR41DRAFT_168282 [Lobosporangium transversale]KAF9916035.1 hypothetical protein BX616_004766 [Lobosporangium transversale]ORZ06295.1 hypothetical protein BCR41DRAFT_168282 [Lobosporangium transversale]|eukprot:XP_021877458.1 hypothetical protein BCR41DRAFT_168282 [Lobosporangium transversale]